MPTSYPCNIPLVVRLMEAIDPRSVLDVGPGYGKYGFLFRERVDDFRWERTIDGFEPFPDYMNRSAARYLYDRWFLGGFPVCTAGTSARRRVGETNGFIAWEPIFRGGGVLDEDGLLVASYDLVLMVDVLEHYEDEAGEEALEVALKLAPKVLISTPVGYPQGPSHGNVHETHRSDWPAHRIAQHGVFADHSDGYGDSPPATRDSVVGVLSREGTA